MVAVETNCPRPAIDFCFAPPSWQTAICLPDDWQKTLVGKDGALLYDYPGKFAGFGTKITFSIDGAQWLKQELASPRVPIVRTTKRAGQIDILEETFAAAPAPARKGPENESGVRTGGETAAGKPPRHDLLIATLRNAGGVASDLTPTLTIESASEITPQPDGRRVLVGRMTTLFCPQPFTSKMSGTLTNRVVLAFPQTSLPPKREFRLAFRVARGENAAALPGHVAEAESLRKKSQRFWEKLDLPYGRIEVPDAGVQALLDSAIRNIYQAREIKKGLPAFQVGPTCYRGLWVVDGSFLLEAITYLGRTNETRPGVKYLMSFQRPDGGFMLIDGHWKETGIALWAITRHARLTGDTNWLRSVWPQVERGIAYIGVMRQLASADKSAPNCGLIPDGFSDGGLADKVPEYTNIYWTLAGMRAAVEAAFWLGHAAQAAEWQRAYDDFYAAFRRGAERDLKTDARGLRYLPIRMAKGEGIPPQKAQWAFLHSIFPGKVFAANDPLVQGNMAMLHAVESQDLVFDTGWLKDGIWTYFGSFYGHAWLWLGDGQKAARTLYAFGNHASPLLCWREEQKPVGQGAPVVGDMPHNWASAEFIRLTRHCLALERGGELHLFEGFPARWAQPGAVTRMRDVLTEFGPLSFNFTVAKDGGNGLLKVTPPKRHPPSRIVLHLDGWTGQGGTMELPAHRRSSHRIQIKVPAGGPDIEPK
ncbi:MAG: hypothetical protein HY735_08265 [Verrucomicrobia bacterium]|nr:hypothetical protein [Verrucomicrobiota bacterium]